MKKANRQRAARAKLALSDYIDEDPHADADQHVADLLCDLRHYCDAMRIDFDACNNMGDMHYAEESETEYPMGGNAPEPLKSPRKRKANAKR